MPFAILILLVGLPLIEIAGFVIVGERIGAAATVAATVLTAALGVAIVRLQGAGLAQRARAAFARDEPPLAETIEALMLALGGLLLLLPGFFSDLIGALLLVPPLRHGMAWLVLERIRRRLAEGRVRRHGIIDGDYRDVTPNAPKLGSDDEDRRR